MIDYVNKKRLYVLCLVVGFACVLPFGIAGKSAGDPGEVKWVRFLDGICNSSALGHGGTIFVITIDTLYALHPADGSVIWMIRTGSSDFPNRAAPVVGANGIVYTVSADGTVYALAPGDGSLVWVRRIGARVIATPAIGADGTLYVGVFTTEAGWGPSVYALDVTDGSVKWLRQGLGRILGALSIGTGGSVYAASYDRNLYALDPVDGNTQWMYCTNKGLYSAPAIGADGTIYLGCDKGMCALDPVDGSEKWGIRLSYSSSWLTPILGRNGIIYVNRYFGPLFAVEAVTGSLVWSTYIYDESLTPVAVGDDGVLYTVFLAMDYGQLTAIDPADGSRIWSHGLGDGGSCPPVIGNDGIIYTGGSDTFCATWSSSTGLADSAWPLFQHDARNSGTAEPVTLNAPSLVTPAHWAVDQAARILLQWRDANFAPQEQGFTLRMKAAGGSYSYIALTPDTTYTILDLTHATTYYWNAKAVGNGLNTLDSAWANQCEDWSFTTSDGTTSQLNPPILTVPVNRSPRQPLASTLCWFDSNAVPQEDGYQVRIKPAGGVYQYYLSGQDVCQCDVSRLIYNTRYNWNVRALGDNAYTFDSTWANGETDWSFDTMDGFSDTGFVKWSLQLGSNIYSSLALGTDGTIFVGSSDGNLYAVNPADHSVIWAFDTGGEIQSSPALGQDGTVYIGAADGQFYALHPGTGRIIWQKDLVWNLSETPAIGRDGTVYTAAFSNTFYALNHLDGTTIWTLQVEGYVTSSPVIGPDDSLYIGVFCDDGSGKLYAVNPQSGTVKWVLDTPEWPPAPAIGADGTLYLHLYYLLRALDPIDGSTKWEFYTGSWRSNTPVIGTDGTVYVNCGKLYAVDPADGSLKWFSITNKDLAATSAIGANGCIYAPGERVLYAVEPTNGMVVWTCPLNSYFYTGLAIGEDGTIYAGNGNGCLLAITSESGGLADSPWPMWQHDVRHTGRAGSSAR